MYPQEFKTRNWFDINCNDLCIRFDGAQDVKATMFRNTTDWYEISILMEISPFGDIRRLTDVVFVVNLEYRPIKIQYLVFI